MRLSTTANSACVANVEINEVFRVIELDAGYSMQTDRYDTPTSHSTKTPTPRSHNNPTPVTSISSPRASTVAFCHASIHSIEANLAIIVPCKNEDVSILDGVLHGIPHDCLIILVSNSEPAKYEAEVALLTSYCTNGQRSAIVAHQHDTGIATAFTDAGMPSIVAPQSSPARIRNGKGEAMIIGTALAKLANKQYVGFVDADNLVAGSVHEYCKVYAAGLHYALNCPGSDADSHAMVRIKWNSKPKVRDGEIVFEKSGRSSRVVNEWMNRLLNAITEGDADERIIQTANAGEHAMSIDLAMGLQFATGYAVEPHQLVDAWERLGSSVVDKACDAEPCDYDLSGYESYPADDSAYDSVDDLSPVVSFTNSAYSTPESSRPPSRAQDQLPTDRSIRILQIETRNPHFHDTGKGEDHISKMQAEGLSAIYHSRLAPTKFKDELREYIKANLLGVSGVAVDGTPNAPRVYPPVSTMDFAVFGARVKALATTLTVVGEDVL
jgi:mannosyl-3-phosphoglycerate synthase